MKGKRKKVKRSGVVVTSIAGGYEGIMFTRADQHISRYHRVKTIRFRPESNYTKLAKWMTDSVHRFVIFTFLMFVAVVASVAYGVLFVSPLAGLLFGMSIGLIFLIITILLFEAAKKQ
jgi:hypothetical protein